MLCNIVSMLESVRGRFLYNNNSIMSIYTVNLFTWKIQYRYLDQIKKKLCVFPLFRVTNSFIFKTRARTWDQKTNTLNFVCSNIGRNLLRNLVLVVSNFLAC